MSLIVRPLTADGLFGYDQFDQLTLSTGPDKHGRTTFTFVADVRAKTCMICQRGWEPNGPSLGDQCRWDLIDEHVHESCLLRHHGFVERALVYEAIVGARLRFTGLKTEPNGYWPECDPYGKYKPWYSTALLDYPCRLLIGTRKRVWSIELIAQDSAEWALSEVARAEFESEKVTKSFDSRRLLLHAWGDDKLREYVKRIAGLLPKADSCL